MNINILNEKNKYSKWIIEEEKEKYYNISLDIDKSIISLIGKDKIYKKDNQFYSDVIKPIKKTPNLAIAPFFYIKLGC